MSNECLNILDVKKISWPSIDKSMLIENFTNIVVQVNGKKRGIVKAKINIPENDLMEIIKLDDKISKYIKDNQIKKKIYIKNKLLNVII